MKSSGIGGQAVMEGIMMKNGEDYAIAVRKPNKEIEIKKDVQKSLAVRCHVAKIPFVRGVFMFIDSLTLGISTLMWSSSFFEEEEADEEPGKLEQWMMEKMGDKAEKVFMTVTVLISLILAIGIFSVLPVAVASLTVRWIGTGFWLSLLESGIRVAIFIAYMALITLMPDIKRTYMYHGAEHKCINCIEHELPLTVEHVRASSRFHKRCGTSFLFLIVIISVVIFMWIRVDTVALRVISRILLIPVIAGMSYEFLRLAGNSDHWLVNLLSQPGLYLQRLTTKEPTDDMIEVAIAAVETVFDWKTWLRLQEED